MRRSAFAPLSVVEAFSLEIRPRAYAILNPFRAKLLSRLEDGPLKFQVLCPQYKKGRVLYGIYQVRTAATAVRVEAEASLNGRYARLATALCHDCLRLGPRQSLRFSQNTAARHSTILLRRALALLVERCRNWAKGKREGLACKNATL